MERDLSKANYFIESMVRKNQLLQGFNEKIETIALFQRPSDIKYWLECRDQESIKKTQQIARLLLEDYPERDTFLINLKEHLYKAKDETLQEIYEAAKNIDSL